MFNEDYCDEYFDENNIVEIKKQMLIKQGVDPERIREDGSYVMTKEEFVSKLTYDLEQRKKQRLREKKVSTLKAENDYKDYMVRLFARRKKRRR